MRKLIKVYSHPRSGTHFLEAFLARNFFYKEEDLSSNGPIYYGHWSNKILLEEGEPYQKLFGGHLFPKDSKFHPKMIYIYRDGRAVISSIYNSMFYHKDWRGVSFSEFLRKEIDWYGGLGQKKYPKMNIVQHWYSHVEQWRNCASNNLLIISYEDLKNTPNQVYSEICKKFYPAKYFKHTLFGYPEIDVIPYKVGLKPNKGIINSWNNLFNDNDLNFFYSQLPSKDFLFKN